MAKNDTKLETKIRTRDEVLADLKSLIRRPGYIYSLCIIDVVVNVRNLIVRNAINTFMRMNS